MRRLYREFNTSSLPGDCTINSATFGGYGHTTSASALGETSIGITGFLPATNGTAVTGDFDSFSDTRLSVDIASTSWSSNSWNNYTLNSDGLSYIKKGSGAWTNIMMRMSHDIDNSSTGLTWCASCSNSYYEQNVEHGTTGNPFLEIVYTTGGVSAPVASFTCTKDFVRIPGSVTCTDSSTNTPTSWSWDWGDGSAASTTQNPSHQYVKRGKWTIVLTATNAGGSDASDPLSVRVVGYENV